ncbi:MAG: hypothetical protein IJ825_10645 [Oscillospiraceae bacterium]|nr:hypothetical protein [Oscillospiraceae bacterium]
MDYYQNSYQQNQGYNQPESGGAFGWDDEIEREDAFTILPEGDYWFRIMKVDKGRYDGGDKISACPKAIVEFEITCPDGSTVTLTENFLLHQKMEWKLSQFFASIGMKAKGEKLKMNWSPAIIGKTGICKVIVHTYQKDGSERQTNRIDRLYPSYDQPNLPPPQQAQPTYQQPVYNQPQQGYGQPQQPVYNQPQQPVQNNNGWKSGSY